MTSESGSNWVLVKWLRWGKWKGAVFLCRPHVATRAIWRSWMQFRRGGKKAEDDTGRSELGCCGLKKGRREVNNFGLVSFAVQWSEREVSAPCSTSDKPPYSKWVDTWALAAVCKIYFLVDGILNSGSLTFEPWRFLYVPPSLTFNNSTWCSLCVECFVRITEQTATFALYIFDWLAFITVVESIYCAVRTGSLYKADYSSSLKS